MYYVPLAQLVEHCVRFPGNTHSDEKMLWTKAPARCIYVNVQWSLKFDSEGMQFVFVSTENVGCDFMREWGLNEMQQINFGICFFLVLVVEFMLCYIVHYDLISPMCPSAITTIYLIPNNNMLVVHFYETFLYLVFQFWLHTQIAYRFQRQIQLRKPMKSFNGGNQ